MESDKGLAKWLNNIVSGHGDDWLLYCLCVVVTVVLLVRSIDQQSSPFGHFALSTSLDFRMSVVYQ